MSLTEGTIMGLHPHNRSAVSCFGLAMARALTRRHPVHGAKMIARELSAAGSECTIRTAENILQGHLSARTLTRLMQAYGIGLFLEAAGEMRGRGASLKCSLSLSRKTPNKLGKSKRRGVKRSSGTNLF
jgi:hypothetical protein